MFNLFKRREPTASEIGRLGNAVKRERDRAKFIATHDDLRARLGLEPWNWTR